MRACVSCHIKCYLYDTDDNKITKSSVFFARLFCKHGRDYANFFRSHNNLSTLKYQLNAEKTWPNNLSKFYSNRSKIGSALWGKNAPIYLRVESPRNIILHAHELCFLDLTKHVCAA